MKPQGYVISMADYTGNMVAPWVEAGYECWIVDLQHEPGVNRDGLLVRVGIDVLDWLPPMLPWSACFAFPPCTDLAVSGARWFQGKGLKRLAKAIEVFGRCVEICEWTGAPWFVENPVSVISTHFRKPDFTFDPCDYGDPYTKKTCLWTGGGFTMPPKTPVIPTDGSKMHLIPPGPDRANLRSETPPGFAKAVFKHMTGSE
jgi:hypothetical protein